MRCPEAGLAYTGHSAQAAGCQARCAPISRSSSAAWLVLTARAEGLQHLTAFDRGGLRCESCNVSDLLGMALHQPSCGSSCRVFLNRIAQQIWLTSTQQGQKLRRLSSVTDRLPATVQVCSYENCLAFCMPKPPFQMQCHKVSCLLPEHQSFGACCHHLEGSRID